VISSVVDTGDKLITGVVDTAEQLSPMTMNFSFAIISVNFQKNLKRSKYDPQGPGGFRDEL
jgi:hypothetical protein